MNKSTFKTCCYGSVKECPESKRKAQIKEYSLAVSCCDGSEKERYAQILADYSDGDPEIHVVVNDKSKKTKKVSKTSVPKKLTAADYMNKILDLFDSTFHVETLNRHSHWNDDWIQEMNAFKKGVCAMGLTFSNCYNANGIGNNNKYTIYLDTIDEDGFRIRKEVAILYYCLGIFGGVAVTLRRISDNVLVRDIGEVR